MPKMKLDQAEFIEMDDDQTFKLFIHDKTYKLSMNEVKTLAAEIYATAAKAKLPWARFKDWFFRVCEKRFLEGYFALKMRVRRTVIINQPRAMNEK